jgi:hypothetical protein
MDQVYHDIYKSMYEAYEIGPEYQRRIAQSIPQIPPVNQSKLRRALDRIKKAIDEYETDSGSTIRPDAKYFLMLNFFELILFPIIAAGEPTNTNQLLEDADSDIHLVLSEAVHSGGQDSEGLSSHSIIRSINSAWDRLKLTDAFTWMK